MAKVCHPRIGRVACGCDRGHDQLECCNCNSVVLVSLSEAFQSKHLAIPSYVRNWLETALHGSDMQQSWSSSTGVTKPVGN
jgi:hypothetical protein